MLIGCRSQVRTMRKLLQGRLQSSPRELSTFAFLSFQALCTISQETKLLMYYVNQYDFYGRVEFVKIEKSAGFIQSLERILIVKNIVW